MIHILCVDTSFADEWIYRKLYKGASDERKRRADRYLRYDDKLRCVTADALLKVALGTDEFQVEKNKFGKPYLKDQRNFYYNLSHSGKFVVIAFGTTEVGIDIQEHRADTDISMIAERFFSEEERNYLSQSEEQKQERFYEVWTGKESYLKYVGKGLSEDLCSFGIFEQRSRISCLQHTPCNGYTLSFCSADKEFTLELSDIRQLG